MTVQTHKTTAYAAWGMFFLAVLSLLLFHCVGNPEIVLQELEHAQLNQGITSSSLLYESAYAQDSNYLLTPAIQCKHSHNRKGKCQLKALPVALNSTAALAHRHGAGCPVFVPMRQHSDGGFSPLPGWKSAVLFPLPPPFVA